MNKEQELQTEFNRTSKKVHLNLEKRFERLVDALYDAEVLHGIGYKYEFFYAVTSIIKMQKRINERQKLIAEHLGMEFRMVECEDHYELRKKEEK